MAYIIVGLVLFAGLILGVIVGSRDDEEPEDDWHMDDEDDD